jgi:hypothetical protein
MAGQSAPGTARLAWHLPWAPVVVHPGGAGLKEPEVDGGEVLGRLEAFGLLVGERLYQEVRSSPSGPAYSLKR